MTMKFTAAIKAFNTMYGLPVAAKPTLTAVGNAAARLKSFKKILLDEVEEVEDIFDVLTLQSVPTEAALAMIADWLGDLQVYCASEMLKFGLPNEVVLAIIMESNLSKLGTDGKPIYDEHGKVLKGPNYWKPEPALEAAIHTLLNPPSHPEKVDFSTWERGNLEKLAHDLQAQNAALRDEFRTAMMGWRLEAATARNKHLNLKGEQQQQATLHAAL